MKRCPQKRDVRIDSMRGLMLVVMTIDHLPNPIREYTAESIGFVTAAEGFVFLSGYVAGLVYTRRLYERGPSAMWRSAYRRSGEIYLYHLLTFVGLFLLLRVFGDASAQIRTWQSLMQAHWLTALLSGATFLYQPELLGILPLYCLLVLFTPLLINGLNKGKLWLILSAACALWALAQFNVQEAVLSQVVNRFPVHSGAFDILGWQLLFVVGLALGFYVRDGAESIARRGALPLTAAFVIVALLFMFRHDFVPGSLNLDLREFAVKRTVGPVRIVNFFALALLIGSPRLWPARQSWVKCLAFLGRNSLQVFTFHIAMVYLLGALWPNLVQESAWLQLTATLATVAALFLPAWVNEVRKTGFSGPRCRLL